MLGCLEHSVCPISLLEFGTDHRHFWPWPHDRISLDFGILPVDILLPGVVLGSPLTASNFALKDLVLFLVDESAGAATP